MSRKAFIFGLLVVVALIAGLYRAKDGARQSSVEIVRLEAEIAEAYRNKRLLEADLAHMSRREWIEEYARNELGMGPARANQFATQYNLDLLIGPAAEGAPVERAQPTGTLQVLPESTPLAEDVPSPEAPVNVPVTDASNPLPEEDAEH